MDLADAVDEVLERAEQIKLPGRRLDVVTIARREFAKRGVCDSKFIDPIENVMKECLRTWTMEQKRQIWLSTETGFDNSQAFEDYDEGSIDLHLEGELMFHLIEALSPRKRNNRRDEMDDADDRFDNDD
jgi:hypothetical protein